MSQFPEHLDTRRQSEDMEIYRQLIHELEQARALCFAAIQFEAAWDGFYEDAKHNTLRKAIHEYQTMWKDHS